jgi:hypothetical protein
LGEDQKVDGSNYWKNLRDREDTVRYKRKHKITAYGAIN